MLPAVHRMRGRDDFTAAVRRGRRAGGRSLVVHLGVSGEDGRPARVGFIVSRVVGSAVTRNRVKRRLRHLTRERLHRLPPGGVLVIRANPAAASSSSVELARDLDRGLDSVLSGTAAAGSQGRVTHR